MKHCRDPEDSDNSFLRAHDHGFLPGGLCVFHCQLSETRGPGHAAGLSPVVSHFPGAVVFHGLCHRQICGQAIQERVFFLWQWFKAGFLMMAVMSVLIFGARMFYFPGFRPWPPFWCSWAWNISWSISITGLWSRKRGNARDIESVDRVREILKQVPVAMEENLENIRERLMSPAREKSGTGCPSICPRCSISSIPIWTWMT